jgi:hypothetical protein
MGSTFLKNIQRPTTEASVPGAAFDRMARSMLYAFNMVYDPAVEESNEESAAWVYV